MDGQPTSSRVRRVSVLGYGLLVYVVTQLLIVYLIGFLANVGVPNGINDGRAGPVGEAVAINLGLITLFGVQHSVMARSWFKDRWTRIIPESIERSTYVLFSSLALLAVAWWWQPLPSVIWDINGIGRWILWAGFGFGWFIVLLSTFQISHTELFGLQQVYAFYRNRAAPTIPFQTPGLYQYVRHPLMTGVFLGIWVTPQMTVGHLLFAVGFSVYILIGVHFEEETLIDAYGEQYEQYRQDVPKFVPRPWQFTDAFSVSTDTNSPQE